MERNITAEVGTSTDAAIAKFKKLFGHGYMFDRAKGLEVRVGDVDKGVSMARDIIVKNQLPLMVAQWGSMATYGAFMVIRKETIT